MIKAVIFDMYETLITQYHCPTYFSPYIARDMGFSYELFENYWKGTDRDRSIGNISFEETIKQFMEMNDCFSIAKFEKILAGRYKHKSESYQLLHPQILPMLEMLKEKGMKIGLISNCFSEEVECMRKSHLYTYLDVPVLSYVEGFMKPDPRIYQICLERLGVLPGECLYIGDGGSNELVAATELGMKPLQAGWYLKERMDGYKMDDFVCLKEPLEVLTYI